jgi:hypothetical protein
MLLISIKACFSYSKACFSYICVYFCGFICAFADLFSVYHMPFSAYHCCCYVYARERRHAPARVNAGSSARPRDPGSCAGELSGSWHALALWLVQAWLVQPCGLVTCSYLAL